MEKYLEKLIIEQKELQVKIDKLDAFIKYTNNKLDIENINDLYAQFEIMKEYNHILLRRIGRAYVNGEFNDHKNI